MGLHFLLAQEPAPSEGVPPPDFEFVRLEDGTSLEAGGFDEYIRSWGYEGWLRGLSDDRPAHKAITGIGSPPELKAAQMGEEDTGLRVKDIFYYYYAREHSGENKGTRWIRNAKRVERDLVIARIISTIRGQGPETGAGSARER